MLIDPNPIFMDITMDPTDINWILSHFLDIIGP